MRVRIGRRSWIWPMLGVCCRVLSILGLRVIHKYQTCIALDQFMGLISSPCSLNSACHNLINISTKIIHVYFDAWLFVFTKKPQLAYIDVLIVIAAYDVFQLLFLLKCEGFRSTNERNIRVFFVLIFEVVWLFQFFYCLL